MVAAPADVLDVAALLASEVQKLLTDALGVGVTVRPGGLPVESAGLAGLYVDGTGRHTAAVWLDRSLAASAGSSLAMIPSDEAVSAPEAGPLPDNLVEQVGEVLNVFGSILNAGRRVKLEGAVQTPPAPLPLADLFGGAMDASWFTIEVAGYGGGVALVVQARSGLDAAA